jgi:hypothetical protein
MVETGGILENRVYNKPNCCSATGALAVGPDHQPIRYLDDSIWSSVQAKDEEEVLLPNTVRQRRSCSLPQDILYVHHLLSLNEEKSFDLENVWSIICGPTVWENILVTSIAKSRWLQK